jgi:hypothetical protein
MKQDEEIRRFLGSNLDLCRSDRNLRYKLLINVVDERDIPLKRSNKSEFESGSIYLFGNLGIPKDLDA